MRSPKKICFVVSTPMTVQAFLKDQIQALSKYFEIFIVANFSDNPEYKIICENAKLKNIPFSRSVKPLQDIEVLFKLFVFLKSEQFSVVHTITPKAGLVGMAAAFLAGIEIRIHTFTGQVWVTRKGMVRWFLKNIDRVTASLTTHVYTDSFSQRDFLIKERIIPSDRIKTLADGSISGVDPKRFTPDRFNRQKIREIFKLKEDSIIILFLGRMNRDKGVKDLVRAFVRIGTEDTHLFLVGPDESGMRSKLTLLAGQNLRRIHFVDYTSEPEKYMTAADIFCLPSYREGFGSVVIEAAACGLPSIASRIYGLTDAVVHGATGFLYPPGDIEKLIQALVKLIENPMLRRKMGKASRNRAIDLFNQKRLTKAVLEEYLALTQYQS